MCTNDETRSVIESQNNLILNFVGYKSLKSSGKLCDPEAKLPKMLIEDYYTKKEGFEFRSNPDEKKLDVMKRRFVSNYVRNESRIEGINADRRHTSDEYLGLIAMYEYIHSADLDCTIESSRLMDIVRDFHKILFSFTPFSEYSGRFRTEQAYLPGSGINIPPPELVYSMMKDLDYDFKEVIKLSKLALPHDNIDVLFEYINRCVDLKCALVKIHPFKDGNGRVARGFLNKLFEMADLPPVYVKDRETREYHAAMNMALGDDIDYSMIHSFYLHKICDSIIELDINDRVRESNDSERIKIQKKVNLQ